MKDNRTDYSIYVEFTHPETKEKETVSVYVPFEVYVKSIVEYCDKYKSVVIDAKDTDVYNLFSELDCLYAFESDENFVNICYENYFNSSEVEEDFDEWIDNYNFLNNLGEYAEED